MDDLRKGCPMRHENGNCTVIGGFCTSVNDPICEGLHNAYDNGYRDAAIRAQQERENTKPMTNADRIRAMSDEELGIFLAEWAEKPWAWKQDGEGECLAWLRQPVKDGE